MEKQRLSLEFPALGQRIIRTVFGIALCYTIFYFRGNNQNVFLAVLAVLQCIQPYMKNSFEMAKQRFFGTLIGAVWGLVAIFIGLYFFEYSLLDYFLGFMIIALIAGVVLYTAVLFNQKESAGLAAVAFLGIVAFPLAGQNPFVFVGGRFVDIMIGVLIAIAVNAFHLPRDRNTNILFVSDIDHIMKGGSDIEIAPNCKIELNHLIERGARFTMSTWRTPASLLSITEDIDLNEPVVVMNGAAIFDVKDNAYIETSNMSYEEASKVMSFLDKYDFNFFINVVVGDALLIYYDKLENEAEKGMYDDTKISPHRNYVQRKLPEDEDVIYLIVIDKGEKIDAAYNDILNQDWVMGYRVEAYTSDEYPEYKILRVYHKNANHKEMLDKIRQKLGLEKVVTIGGRKQRSDIIVENADVPLMVKKLREKFEPVNFSIKNIFRK